MHLEIWRFYFLLLSWIILVQTCKGQTVLLTLIDDLCITDTSSAMAMIYNLSDPFLETMEQFKEISEIKSKDKETSGSEGMYVKPESFSSKPWQVVNSLESQRTDYLITDRRWEDFPIIVTKEFEGEDKVLTYRHAASFSDSVFQSHKVIIPFSVHVEDEAHVFLCDGDQVPNSNCYWFMLQAWKSLASGFRKCKKQDIQFIFDGIEPKEFCNKSTIKWKHNKDFPKFLSKHQWNHFKIIKTGNEYNLEYPNGSKIFSVDTADFPIIPRNLFFHTKDKIGLWKVHKFNYYYSEIPITLESTTELTVSKGRNCLSAFTAMCTNCQMSIELYEIIRWYGSKEKLLVEKHLNFQEERWKEVKLVFNMTESKKDVYFRIIPKSSRARNNFWAFMDLRPCNLDEIRVLKPAHPQHWTHKCQHIETTEIIDIARNKNISTLGNWNKCKDNQFGEDCLPCKLVYDGACVRNRKYCQLIKTKDGSEHKCYCSIGNEGDNCEGNCRTSYGHSCKKSCENCRDSCSRDPVGGKCDSKDCMNNHIGEKCDIPHGIFIFDNFPDVEVGFTSCNLTMNLFEGKVNLRMPPLFYKFQYKETNEEQKWRNVIEEPLRFGEPKTIVLQNLNLGSSYFIRVFGFNSEADLQALNFLSHAIPTQGIQTQCYVPKKIEQLEVTSKGNNHISLRWLPPYPPTGQITEYKITYCFTPYWKECNTDWNSDIIEPKSCKLWPDYQCYTIKSPKEDKTYTIKVQAKIKGNSNYSEAVRKEKIRTDNKQKSNPPYGVKMKWTEENHLCVTWFHPNATGGTISSFRIHVNGIKYEYEIDSENNYYLVYNYTVKNHLTFPDFYNVEIVACNKAGESNKTLIREVSPPPIPEESIEKIEAKGEHISVLFKSMKKYKIVFKRFLYVLITECNICQDKLSFYKSDLLAHHIARNEIKPIYGIIQHQWRVIKTYANMENPNNYPKKLEIGENTDNNIYCIKPNTKYSLAFIWIYRLENYVRMNTSVIFTNISPTSISTNTNISIERIYSYTVTSILVFIIILVYLWKKQEINKKVGEVFRCSDSVANLESAYDNLEMLEIVGPRSSECTRNTSIKHILKIICPGDPLFNTRCSRRVKEENFQQYLENACFSNELLMQYEKFVEEETSLSTNTSGDYINEPKVSKMLRVIFEASEGSEYYHHSDASFINGYMNPKAYIVTRHPRSIVERSVADFWQTVWQEKITFIFMITDNGDKEQMEQYWPDSNEKQLLCDDFTISFINEKSYSTYDERKFSLRCQQSKPRKVHQLHFKGWPDQGVPKFSKSLIPVLEKLQCLRANDFPVIVHCSDGAGKSGTVILCDICLRMIATEGSLDVLAILEDIRNQRLNMVDTAERYKFAHFVILNYLVHTKKQ